MVGKYDGPNDDSTCFSCISHRLNVIDPRECDLGYRCGSGSIDRIFWRNLNYIDPRHQIGYRAVQIVTGVPEAIPVIGSPLVELLRGSASVGHLDSFF
ncbi:Cytochrome b6 [Striga hermonthica]|uniref:Cytochrome b6 n=1 Tax=Striga hermonthica TaxID=68872 RepID=A0A9N7N359_STRHE|nr:Cytochrome b6 [Striga hermonthica]